MHNYSKTSQTGNWHWYNPYTLFPFHQFYVHPFACVYHSIKFYNIYRLMWPPSQSWYWTVPAPQGFPVLIFYNRTHLLSLSSNSLATTKLFSISIILLFKNITLSILAFFSLNIILWISIQVVPGIKSLLLLLLSSILWHKCITVSLISHLLQDLWFDSRSWQL